ncbi:hypothetical protein AB3N02_22810 [Priestia aryabhattai]|uniref:hypothetical protein n=1 Tax=Priestia aryabhattai TaxID=412384 RepID=UPI0039A33150
MELSKKQKEQIKKQIEEATELNVAGVQKVWANGRSGMKYCGQDKMNTRRKASSGYKIMLAVYIDVDGLEEE